MKQKGYKARRRLNWVLWPEVDYHGEKVEVNFDSLATLLEVLEGEDYKDVMEELERYCENIAATITISRGPDSDEVF